MKSENQQGAVVLYDFLLSVQSALYTFNGHLPPGNWKNNSITVIYSNVKTIREIFLINYKVMCVNLEKPQG